MDPSRDRKDENRSVVPVTSQQVYEPCERIGGHGRKQREQVRESGRKREQWEKVGNRTQGEKRRGRASVECALAVIGTGGPVQRGLSQ
eukprot:4454729-Pyramimonas_sp.AAC.2